MEESERIKFAIQEWYEKSIKDIKKRDINIKLFTEIDHIIDIVGVRRAGKTYLMYMVIEELKNKFKNSPIIYINFENKILYPLNEKLLDELINYILRNDFTKAFLFLDEIQTIKGWEHWARTIYDSYKEKIKIVVSGSTSKIIRKEIATLLTGRHVSIKLFPLSFIELLKFNGIEINKETIRYSIQQQIKIKVLLEEYLKFGSFPEVCLNKDEYLKLELLRSYYDDILYKDVADKYNIQEKDVLENFVKFLLINISGYFSYKKGKEYLNSLGIPTSTRTLLKYTSILEEVFFFFFITIFAGKVREQSKYPRKMYVVDIGLRNVVYPLEDFGKKAENVVYLELRRKLPDFEINYWKSKRDEEVDFILRQGKKIKELIQVCWDISNEKTKKREVTALLKAMEEFKLNKGLIITNNLEKKEIIDNKRITYTPLWKWLLS